MKILHTGDWHLGQDFFHQSRVDEYVDLFRQLRKIVSEEHPDVFMVCGDVYHTAVPSNQIQRLYTDSLLAIHEEYPEMEIVVTAGNHDSASRLEVDSALWGRLHVHVKGSLPRNEAREIVLDDLIIEVKDKGFVVAVPYVYPQNLPSVPEGEERHAVFFQSLLSRVAERNDKNLPVVLMAHLAACCNETRCDVAGHHFDTDEELGGLQYVDLSSLHGLCDYVALGHIHHPQGVPFASKSVRYSGSPLAVHFDESYEHSVTLVDLECGKEPQVRQMAIESLRPLLTLPKEPVSFDEALEQLSAFPADKDAYIRLHVKSNNGLPVDCMEQAQQCAEGKRCRFCTFKVKEERRTEQTETIDAMTPEELSNDTPASVAARYLAGKGIALPEAEEMINSLVREIEEETRQ